MTDHPCQLHHLKIAGFKSILHADLSLSPVNILIGANGAGKSNFLESFNFLRAMAQGRLQNYVQQHGGGGNLLHVSPQKKDHLGFTLSLDQFDYHCDLHRNSFTDSLGITGEYIKQTEEDIICPLHPQNNESALYYDDKDTQTICQPLRLFLQNCRVYHFQDTSQTACFKQSYGLDHHDFLLPDARNIAPFLYFLRHKFPAAYHEIIQTIRNIAPFFHDFYLTPFGQAGDQSILLKWTHQGDDEPFSAQQLSDGTARFICLVTLLLQPDDLKPPLIILDEPELGLHPAALEVIAEIIQSISDHTQIICSTQSVTFTNHFAPEDLIIVDHVQGASHFSRPDKQKLDIWLQDYQMGDIWNKNLIGGRP